MIDFDITAVIPARLGSSRVEKKVFQEISPRESLMARKIKQLREILPSDRVIVNTEAEEIADVASSLGATVHYREQYYANAHDASFSEVIMHVIAKIESEHIAWTPFVVPFFDAEQFEKSFSCYSDNVINGEFDSLVSVVKLKDYIWDDRQPLNYCADKNHTISQDLPCWYRVSNGNYMAPKQVMIENEYLLGKRVFLDEREDYCGIDIDTLHDLKVARAYEMVVRGDL